MGGGTSVAVRRRTGEDQVTVNVALVRDVIDHELTGIHDIVGSKVDTYLVQKTRAARIKVHVRPGGGDAVTVLDAVDHALTTLDQTLGRKIPVLVHLTAAPAPHWHAPPASSERPGGRRRTRTHHQHHRKRAGRGDQRLPAVTTGHQPTREKGTHHGTRRQDQERCPDIAGKAKEAFGNATNNDEKVAEGKKDQAAASAKQTGEDVKDVFK